MSNGSDGPDLKKPKVNAYRYGTLESVHYIRAKESYAPVLKLVGQWVPEGHGHWLAPWKAVIALARAGLLEQLPGDGKQFQITPTQRLAIRRLQNGQAHDWTAWVLDAANNPITLPPCMDPVAPPWDGPPAASPPPTQPSGPTPAGPPPPPPGSGPGPTPPPQQPRDVLAAVDERYGTACAMSAFHHARTLDRRVEDLNEGAIAVGAAAIICELPDVAVSSGQTKALIKRLHEFTPTLET